MGLVGNPWQLQTAKARFSELFRQARTQGPQLITRQKRILDIDVEIADRWGQLSSEARRRGKVLPVIDALLAATALHHNLTVITRNVDDFRDTPVSVFSPWE